MDSGRRGDSSAGSFIVGPRSRIQNRLPGGLDCRRPRGSRPRLPPRSSPFRRTICRRWPDAFQNGPRSRGSCMRPLAWAAIIASFLSARLASIAASEAAGARRCVWEPRIRRPYCRPRPAFASQRLVAGRSVAAEEWRHGPSAKALGDEANITLARLLLSFAEG